MGTNYYLHKPACLHCGRGDEPLHIGKSSAGWCFALHVIPEEINDLDDWIKLWKAPAVIKDEYGRELTCEEMYAVITQRSWKSASECSADFLESNHAQSGPNGLVRARLDGRYCIGHGEGTWDHIVGEFS
jgi:hypothetical protein